MMARVRQAFMRGERISGADASFYMHEISESTMMRRGMPYTAAHQAAIDKYRVSPYTLYHSDIVRASPIFSSNPWWRRFHGLD